MQLGFALPYAGSWATPANQATIAQRAEQLGYASLWSTQRLIYPAAPVDEYHGNPGGPWPEPFRSVMDPIVPLAYVAALTSRIRIGTCSLQLGLANPLVLGKQLATLDVVSGGRLNVGVSLGWSRDEYAAVGTEWARRGARQDEFLDCLRAVWAGHDTAFDGEFFTLPRGDVLPAPLQRPHPPLLVGGYSKAALRRAAHADGYLAGLLPFDRVAPLLDTLAEIASAAGRDPESLRMVGRGVVVLTGEAPAGPRPPLTGTLDQLAADVDRYAETGMTELFLDLNLDPRVGSVDADPAASLDQALRVMEHLAGPDHGGTWLRR
jgi:probable F420-dependent oxidoreductase